MFNRIRVAFLLLIMTQGLHSIEEYYGKLWNVLAPARFISSAVSSNLAVGFLIINIGLFLFGLFSWLLSTRKQKISFQGLIWIWIVIEIINGIGHPLFALAQSSYFPGLYTAPFLLVLALYLARQLSIYPQSASSNTA